MQRDALTLGFVPNRTTLFSFGFNITEATDSILVGGLVGAVDTDTLGGIADGFQFKNIDKKIATRITFSYTIVECAASPSVMVKACEL
jgi:hypothetical protein